MLNIKRKHSFEFIFGIVGLILFIGLIYFIVDHQGNTQQLKEMQKEIKNSYQTVMEQNKQSALLLFELQFNDSVVISLLQKASNAQTSQSLRKIKKELYQSLNANFQSTREYFPKQQIYLVDGHPLLSLDSPYQDFDESTVYNVGLNKVIKGNVAHHGLALQDGVYLYRYFFPIFDDQHLLIAVAEVGLPLANVKRFLFTKYGAVSQFMFTKRQLLDISNRRKLYQESVLSSAYYVLKRGDQIKKHNTALSEQEYLRLKSHFNKDHEEALLTLQAFSLQEELKNQDSFINFLPLKNISSDLVGHLFTYTPKASLTIQNDNRSILLLLVTLLFLLMSYYLYKKSENNKNSLEFYINTIDALPFPVFCKDDKNNYQCANTAFFKHFNLSPDTIFSEAGKAFQNEPEALQVSSTELADLKGIKSIKERVIDEVGMKNLAISLFLIENKDKKVEGVLGYIVDETSVINTQQQLEETLKLQEQLINSLSIGVRIFDINKEVKLVNREFEKLSGYNKLQLIDTACEKFFTCLQCSPEVCPLNKAKTERLATNIETIKYTQQGEIRTLAVDFNPLYDSNGILNGIVEISTDVSETKNLRDKTHELITCDELTGLLNLRGLMSSGDNYFKLAQRTNTPFFSLHFDIHGMRKLNYRFGEDAGDKLLKDFALILIETFRDTDLLARIGGDEFVVLLNDADYKIADSAHFVRLELNVQKYNLQPDNKLKLLVDTGIVQYSNKTHKSLDMLLDQCEKLVYEQQLKRTIS